MVLVPDELEVPGRVVALEEELPLVGRLLVLTLELPALLDVPGLAFEELFMLLLADEPLLVLVAPVVPVEL